MVSLTTSIHRYAWHWNNQTFSIAYDTIGQGCPILLLPAFSTVSSRSELQGIANRLAHRYQVTTLDWLGFGEADHPALEYNPVLFHQLLQDFVQDTFSQPIAIAAAGHAAGYALQLAQQPQTCSKLVLMAPTWRGPLPTMGVNSFLRSLVCQLVRSPLLGQALYQANTTNWFLRLMYGRHVYVDQTRLTPEFIAHKRRITQQPGARFAPAAFVTGMLDPVNDRQTFLNLIHLVQVPILVLIAEQAPLSSKAEMCALISLPNVTAQTLPGTLGLYEEYSEQVADAMLSFL